MYRQRDVRIESSREEITSEMLSDHLVTIRSASGHRTFRLGPGLLVSAVAAGIGLLSWAVFTTGLTMWHLTGIAEPDESERAARGQEIEMLNLQVVQLRATADSLRNQAMAAMDLLQESVSEKIAAETILAESGLAGSAAVPAADSGGKALTDNRIEFLLTALERTIAELDSVRLQHRESKGEIAALQSEMELSREKLNRLVTRMIESMSLASEGIENIFRALGISPESAAQDARSIYSGVGGGQQIFEFGDATIREFELELRPVGLARLADEFNRINLNRLAYLSIPIGHPVKARNRYSSGFGTRQHPISKRLQRHDGADFAAPRGTPVYTTGDGVVSFAGLDSGYGKTVRIRHGSGHETVYGHLDRIRVTKGQRVTRNERIGDLGSTGQSTGPHLHYEVRVGKKPVDPMKYIGANGNVY